MAILTLRNISIGFGETPLLDNANLTIEPGEKVCVVGRNGTGKSTLLKLIGSRIAPDSGELRKSKGIRCAGLFQEAPKNLNGTVAELVCPRAPDAKAKLPESFFDSETFLDHDFQEMRKHADRIISKMSLLPDDRVEEYSAGMKRRVLLARAVALDPDILLLDEPTNHLDIDSIAWLESFMDTWKKTILFVTHDRVLTQKIATRIIEIDRGRIIPWNCGYDLFLKRRQQSLDVQERQNAVFDKKLSAEEKWIRQGIKARRTRNEGRVRSLEKMREKRRQRRDRIGAVTMNIQDAGRAGKLVMEADGISFGYDNQPLLDNFSTTIMRGDRVGIIGPNGSGKTTLVKILLKKLAPKGGSFRHGVNLEILYFDQLRFQLDETKTVQENVADGNDTIMIGGRRRHIIGYLKDFLFSPRRSRTPVKVLSGGEKNRLLLAKLFTRPSNVLVMDEPTNDLDIETLELLEELLMEYKGTLLLVSHDRAFINNVVTSTLAFEGKGCVNEYVGGYDDWLRQRKNNGKGKKKKARGNTVLKKRLVKKKPVKLSYMEQRELEALPGKIEALEAKHSALCATLSDPDFFKKEKDRIAAVKTDLEKVEQDLGAAFERWEHLEEISSQLRQ